MRKQLFAIALILSPFVLRAQEARTLFNSIPEAMLPMLSPVNRADFIDFIDSGMKARVKNKFGDMSEMTDLTDSYIRIKPTDRSTWEMKVLPANDSTKIICVVSTVCGPACDSAVDFYTAGWEKLTASDYLAAPVADDFFQLPDSTRLDDYTRYRNGMTMTLATAALSGQTNTLTFTLTTPTYAGSSAERQSQTTGPQPFLRNPPVYLWENDPLKGTYLFKRIETPMDAD
ncbi:MAG: DUF3256 family protein [Mediterranea sp.]|jgi:hypothetical protein|nr:DUF3256 family protein [Mediterranea sp.]